MPESAVSVSITGTSGNLYYTFAQIGSNVVLRYGYPAHFSTVGTAATGTLDSTTLYTLSMEINLDSANTAYTLTKAGRTTVLASDAQTISDLSADGWGFGVYSTGASATDPKNPAIRSLQISAYY